MSFHCAAQLQGPCNYQEDRICVLEIADTDVVAPSAKREQFMRNVIAALHQETFVLNRAFCGSTCTIGLIMPDNGFTIGWLGDSPALLLSGNSCNALTREHIPGYDPEFKITDNNCEDVQGFQRVKSLHTVGEEEGELIYQKLAVSRALGDNDFPLIRRPDVVHGRMKTGDMLVIASDGINTILDFEGHFKSDAGINLDYARDDAAAYLAERAHLNRPYKKGDNISVITVPFTANRSSILLTAVFDGHGGHAVADFAAWRLPEIAGQQWQKIFSVNPGIKPQL